MKIKPFEFIWRGFHISAFLAGALLLAVNSSRAQQKHIEFHAATDTIDGFTLHYRIGGSGPYLLMLHGFTLTGDQWVPFAKAFMTSHTVIVADLPGHGGSSPLPGEFSFEKAAQLMHGLLDELGAQQVYGIGHSGGGITLLHMAVQQPQRFGAMVLVAGPHHLGPEARKMVREDTFDRMEPEVQQFYRALHPGGQPQVDLIFRQYHGLEHNQEDIAPEVLSTLPAPVLLVWGDRDDALPLKIPLEMYRCLPHAALWVLPGQSHAPLWSDLGGDAGMAERFVEVAKNFMMDRAIESIGK